MIEKTEWYIESDKIETLYADHYIKGNNRLFYVTLKALYDLNDVSIILGNDTFEGYVFIKTSDIIENQGWISEYLLNEEKCWVDTISNNDNRCWHVEGEYTEVKTSSKNSFSLGKMYENDAVDLDIKLYIDTGSSLENLYPIPLYVTYRGDIVENDGWIYEIVKDTEKCWVDTISNNDNRCWGETIL